MKLFGQVKISGSPLLTACILPPWFVGCVLDAPGKLCPPFLPGFSIYLRVRIYKGIYKGYFPTKHGAEVVNFAVLLILRLSSIP